MSYPVFYVPSGDVLPIFFDSFDGGTGASITLTGLAVTDIEIYKDGSVTQRASDAGYVLLDTDGIDFDAITGIHGFSIDTGDNTDAGFYAVGAWYHVVVSAVTIDAQTVSFVAAAFRIMAAEGVAGVPDANTTHIADTAQTANDVGADVDAILVDTGTTLDGRIPAALVGGRIDASVGAMAANVMTAAAAAADLTTELQTGLATAAALDVVDNLLDTEIADIQARLPAALVGGRMDSSVGAVAAAAIAAASFAAGAFDAVWTVAARLLTAGTNIVLAKGVGVTGFTDLSAAQVNAEVVDALATDTYAEPGQEAPGATVSLATKINYLFKSWRNKKEQTATERKLYADDGTTVHQKATDSDDGTTYTKGEIGTGP